MTESLMRLHITPFNPELLAATVGPNLLHSVTDISYHTIETFPENSFGFISLPTMDAEKVKKKVNGAILKGKKIKVEEARPQKRRRLEEGDEGAEGPNTAASKAPSTRHKRTDRKDKDIISGHELDAGRKIKRGWTEAGRSKSSKRKSHEASQPASKYTDNNEMLFRTKLPPNKQDLGGLKKVKAKSKGDKGDHVVHEFEKSTKQPSFLRQDVGLGIHGNLDYVEGKGWLDENGQVVEPESQRVLRQRQATHTAATSESSIVKNRKASPSVSSSSSGSDIDSQEQEELQDVDTLANEVDETSSSGSSDTSSNATEASDDSKSSSASQEDKTSDTQDVHPLEKLFKKPKTPASQDVAKPSLELSTGFSFFGAGTDDDNADEPMVPLTPFTSQDFKNRGIRSAAPTPDTAYPSRFNSYGSTGLPGDEDLEDGSDLEDSPHNTRIEKNGPQLRSNKSMPDTPSRPQSDFEKKFWENRGDNNRAWKQRRRAALKEKRQRDNKARRPKNW
ncbi:hypothetical protein B0A52_05128 [Exophiala mesophila]|uniref:Uncharacterized protein n=1 Tax=Exophiala mesophila TaxID=212818 RepID=A0A438N7D2_EXOME|nr:hypothetical protein B0A52_05128 [Exophiala mesophila]